MGPHTPPAGDLDLAQARASNDDMDDPEAGDAAAVTTTLGDVAGAGSSDADGSALD